MYLRPLLPSHDHATFDATCFSFVFSPFDHLLLSSFDISPSFIRSIAAVMLNVYTQPLSSQRVCIGIWNVQHACLYPSMRAKTRSIQIDHMPKITHTFYRRHFTGFCLLAFSTHWNRVVETKSDTFDFNVYIVCRQNDGHFFWNFPLNFVIVYRTNGYSTMDDAIHLFQCFNIFTAHFQLIIFNSIKCKCFYPMFCTDLFNSCTLNLSFCFEKIPTPFRTNKHVCLTIWFYHCSKHFSNCIKCFTEQLFVKRWIFFTEFRDNVQCSFDQMYLCALFNVCLKRNFIGFFTLKIQKFSRFLLCFNVFIFLYVFSLCE